MNKTLTYEAIATLLGGLATLGCNKTEAPKPEPVASAAQVPEPAASAPVAAQEVAPAASAPAADGSAGPQKKCAPGGCSAGKCG